MQKNTGIPYEQLAKRVFNEILNQKGVHTIDVKHNVTLTGKTTSHQIDVYWEFEIGGITYTTIVQAKDWSTYVSQGEILKFKAILDDLPGQPRGVFVTRTGYQSGAKTVADANGIKLYELRQPVDDDWKDRIKVIVINMHILVPRMSPVQINPDREWVAIERKRLGIEDGERIEITFTGLAADKELYDSNGSVVGTMGDAASHLLRGGDPDAQPIKKTYDFDTPVFLKTNHDKMPLLKIHSIEAEVSFNKISREIRIDAGEVVGLILKDIITNEEYFFDKNASLKTATLNQ